MKPTLLKTYVRNFCLVLTLAASLLGISALPTSAQTNSLSEEINNAILLPGSIRPEWKYDDPNYKWPISDNKLYRGESSILFSYESNKPTIIELGAFEESAIFFMHCVLCGDFIGDDVGTTGNKKIIMMPEGRHTFIVFYEDIVDQPPGSNFIYSLGIYECDASCDLSGLLTPKSLPIEIINDKTNPWYLDGDGNCKTSFTDESAHATPLKFRFTTEKPCKLSWESKLELNNWYLAYSTSGYTGNVNITHDCESRSYLPQTTEIDTWSLNSAIFTPGTHEITFYGDQAPINGRTQYGFIQPMIRNVELTNIADYGEEINNAILLPGSIIPTWDQPIDRVLWKISDNQLYPFINNALTFSYVSDKPTMIEIGALETTTQFILTENDTNLLDAKVDTTGNKKLVKMPPGEHTISIQQNSAYNNQPSTHNIYSLGIFECDKSCDLSRLITAKSLPIEIVNDSINPWYMDGEGNCKTSFTDQSAHETPIKFIFSTEKTCTLSWESKFETKNTSSTYSSNGYVGNVNVIHDCDSISHLPQTTVVDTWSLNSVVLTPGTHEVTFYGCQTPDLTKKRFGFIQPMIRNLELSNPDDYSGEEINRAILLPGSITPKWSQPTDGISWRINDNQLYPYLNNALTFSYESDKPTMIEVGALETATQFILTENGMTLLDARVGSTGNKKLVKMPSGAHTISIQLDSPYNNQPSTHHIYSLGIYECDKSCDLSRLITAKSLPIEIVNDSITPWYIDGEGICKTSFTDQFAHNIPLKIKFTVDKPSCLSWNYSVQTRNTNREPSSNGLGGTVTILNECDTTWIKASYYSELFTPGTYEVTFYGYQYRRTLNYNAFGFMQIQLSNIELKSDWVDVVSSPGDLSHCVIDEIAKDNYKSLSDVRLLKVRGEMNTSDWTDIAQMSNIKGLDLSEAKFTTLPANQFRENKQIVYISLPSTMETVGKSAFKDSRLRFANLSEGTKQIGDSAFYGTAVRNIILSPTVKENGINSFNSTSLKKVTFPASIEQIGNYAFAFTSLKDVSFPENSRLKHLGNCAFNNCENLETVELPDSMTSFGTNSLQYMFWDSSKPEEKWSLSSESGSDRYPLYYSGTFAHCPKLKSIKFPANLEYIPDGICWYSTELESVVFPKRLKTVGVASFLNTSLNEITLPDSVATISALAFAEAQENKECKLTLPESIKTIGTKAFYCNGITDVRLPLRLSSLGSSAFGNNTRMKRIQLHSGARELGNVVDGCSALETIVLPCATPPTLASDEDFVGSLNKKKINLVVPDFALSSYRLDPYWYTFGAINSGVEATDQLYWNVTGNLRLREGKRMIGTPDVDVASGSSITVIGNAAASFGKVTLMNEPHYYYYKSSSDNKSVSSYSRFITESPATTVGTFEARCKVYPGQWYMLTPLYDVNLADVKVEGTTATSKPNYVFRYYDASSRAAGYNNATASSNWRNVSTPTLKAGQGYIFQTDAEGTLLFPEVDGSTAGHLLSTTAAEIPLREMPSNTTANAHWNFIGNPYAAWFDVWYLDLEAPITVYGKSDTGAITYKAISLTDDKRLLAPMEPFFVQKPDTASVARFDIEGRRPTATYGDHQGQKVKRQRRDDVNRKLFNIELLDKDGQSIDQTRVVINEKAMLDYEIACDASKFMAEAGAQIYTIDPERTRMAINERPLADGIVPLVIRTGDERSCTIAATRADGNVWLRDELTGDEIDITTSPYVVNCKANTSIEGRFSLRFAPVQTGIIDPAQKARVEAGAGYIAVENPAEAEVAIYNASGIEAMHSSEKSIRHELPAGIYMVRIGADTHKLIVK